MHSCTWRPATAAAATTSEMGCFATGGRAADTTDLWEMTKVRRLPKFGVQPGNATAAVSFYIRDVGSTSTTSPTPARVQPYDDRDRRARPGGSLHRPCERRLRQCRRAHPRWTRRTSRTPWSATSSCGTSTFDGPPSSAAPATVGSARSFRPRATPAPVSIPTRTLAADQFVDGVATSNLKQVTGPPDNPAPYFDPHGHDGRLALPVRRLHSALVDVEQQGRAPEAARAAAERRRPGQRSRGVRERHLPAGQPGRRRRLSCARRTSRRSRWSPNGSTPFGASLVSFRNWYKGCTSSTERLQRHDRLGRLRGVERLLLGLPAQVRPRPHRRRRDLRRRSLRHDRRPRRQRRQRRRRLDLRRRLRRPGRRQRPHLHGRQRRHRRSRSCRRTSRS